ALDRKRDHEELELRSAEAMGGTLAAEDTPGGGLTMVLTLRAEGSREGLLGQGATPVEPERQVI
ncbi:MAG: hypothetical protein ACJ736_07505, partial [Streptomyces sp.]